MNASIPTNRADVHEALHAITAAARALAGSLPPDQIRWQPAPNRWSVGQCLEHVTVSARQYAAVVEPAILRAKPRHRVTGADRFTFSLLGGMLIKMLSAPGKQYPAPKRFAPSSSPGPETLPDFERAHDTLARLLENADGLALARIKTHSPLSRLLRLNVADCFTIVVIHARRHLEQAKRVMEDPRFPTRSG